MNDALKVRCTGCGARLHVREKHYGKEVPCPKCKTIVRIPIPSAVKPPGIDRLACSKCGQEVEDGTRYCAHCGEGLGQACPNCQEWIATGASFCKSCGFSMDEAEGYDRKPVLTIRAQAMPWIAYLGTAVIGSLLLMVFFSPFLVVGLGMIYQGFMSAAFLLLPGFVFFGVGSLGVFGPVIRAVLKRKNLEKAEYRFYHTKLEFFDGFGIHCYRTIPYAQIDGLAAKQEPIFERRYGVGDIYVNTFTEGTVILEEVPDFHETYKLVSDIMSRFSMTSGGRAIVVGKVGAGLLANGSRRRLRR